ncbi:CaiB/BaiF CoA transferase family protein [Candidimonas nitroreducens]|uniref:Formyl-CoA transferase n=1 Tax=Candidimonas nitroreducens TaxID=683354 RepID=A0A225MFY4_9BURK|nr:CoA transferase [Candidimonas nitroreducens]OWT60165.1 formyl-CoA transferase [Candidimonas nitroreducens]
MNTLDGIRVVDFSKVLAGPLCTQYLADMGAEVVKVETVNGDDTRRWPPFRDGEGTVFLSANRNKRSLALDLKHERGREVVRRLIADADVVVESYGPGVAQRLGIDYEAVRELNPALVYCSISGFGRQGPMKDAKGYDVILQAFSGMMATTGEPDGSAARSPYSPIDQATGMHAAIGILSALIRRMRGGEGGLVEACLFDTSLGFLAYMSQSYWQRGTEPQRWGSAHESLCPYQAFDASDKPFLLGIANDALWQAFCRVAEAPALAADVRYAVNADRVSHRAEVLQAVQAILARRSRDEWLELLRGAGVPCAPIQTVGEMLAHPHTRECGMLQTCTAQDGQPLSMVAQPLRFDGRRNDIRRPPPRLGEHSREILAGLGYDGGEIEALLQAGTIQAPRHAGGAPATDRK